ncbi:DUF6682 family protein [Vibrio rhizosphaerae]|uniref:DUF6682 family protein n=1 Tax=Vibrio rhizosphaerae TaxID=398736 RepID=A0ABU4IXC9_9VIBR|nr:DUF6682 family protein [Vibrio rhizosphaerae]MDW6094055.1 DUF6682 family protein [Vibrio rhizosphaerae]
MINVSKLIERAGSALVDSSFTLWSKGFHLDSLNDAIAALTMAVPKSSSKTADIEISAGQWKVSLPEDGYSLLAVNHCDGYGMEQIDLIRLTHLYPDWRKQSDTRPANWMFNPDDNQTFFIFPASESPVSIEIEYSRYLSVASEEDDIDIHEIYSSPLLDYMMYRAYSRDGQAEAQQAKAVAHFQAFQMALGIQTQQSGRRR